MAHFTNTDGDIVIYATELNGTAKPIHFDGQGIEALFSTTCTAITDLGNPHQVDAPRAIIHIMFSGRSGLRTKKIQTKDSAQEIAEIFTNAGLMAPQVKPLEQPVRRTFRKIEKFLSHDRVG